jgi:hypothetical protein
MSMATETIDRAEEVVAAVKTQMDNVSGAVAQFDKIAAGIAAIELAHPKDVACAVATPAGMKQAIAGRAAWREPRIAVEKARKAAKAPVLALGRSIDAFASQIEQQLLEGESNYDDQIKAEEARKEAEKEAKRAAEQARVDGIRERIARLAVAPSVANQTSAQIATLIPKAEAVEIGQFYDEFEPQAQAAKAGMVKTLREMFDAAVVREAEAARIEAERAELARLRAEQAERERIAAEQAAKDQAAARAAQEEENRKAAAARAQADKEAAERRAEADRIAAEQRAAEQVKIDTERAELLRQQAEAEAERKRIADAEAAAREAERKHLLAMHRHAPMMLRALEKIEAMRLSQFKGADDMARAAVSTAHEAIEKVRA